jgi:hypothetical protein
VHMHDDVAEEVEVLAQGLAGHRTRQHEML